MDIGLGLRVEVSVGHGGVVGGSIDSTVDSSERESSRGGVVGGAVHPGGVSVASVTHLSNLSLGNGETRENSDKGLHCDLANCYY